MMKRFSNLVIFVFCILAFTACNKNEPLSMCESGEPAKFDDYTGLDGCGVVLLLDNNTDNETVLEIMNPEDFVIKADGKTNYCVSYEFMDDLASICMIGRIVRLTDVTEN